MSLKLVVDGRARADLQGHSDYIAQDSFDAAMKFWDMFGEAAERVRSNPEIGKPWDPQHEQLGDIRWWRIRGFERYLIFYCVRPDRIEVLRVLHGMRDLPTILEEEEG